MSRVKRLIVWLTIDPGETTGWAIWIGTDRVEAGQTALWRFIDLVDGWAHDGIIPPEFNAEGWADEIAPQALEFIVMEDWSLYADKAQALINDKQRTVRGIGAIELIARQNGIPIELQGAYTKDVAIAAGAEEMFLSPVHENRHANDATMHGVFYIVRKGIPKP